MNTYTVQYWAPGSTSTTPTMVTVHAYTLIMRDDYLTLIDDHDRPLFAVPVALNPVVTQTATG